MAMLNKNQRVVGIESVTTSQEYWISLDMHVCHVCLSLNKCLVNHRKKTRGKIHLGFLAPNIHLEHYFPNVQTFFKTHTWNTNAFSFVLYDFLVSGVFVLSLGWAKKITLFEDVQSWKFYDSQEFDGWNGWTPVASQGHWREHTWPILIWHILWHSRYSPSDIFFVKISDTSQQFSTYLIVHPSFIH